MKNYFAFLVVVACWFLPNAGLAAQPKVVTVYGAGTVSCGEYVEARQSRNLGSVYQFQAWMNGYFSAVSSLRPHTEPKDVKFGRNDAALLLWLENYCREKPLVSFVQAVQKLRIELKP